MRTRLVPFLAVAAVLELGSCAGNPAPPAVPTNPLVNAITTNLGVSPEQAAGGLGTMLALVKNRLPPEQSGTVMSAVPGSGDLLTSAAPLAEGAPITTLAQVQGIFSKLGMSPDMVSKFSPYLSNAASRFGGSQLAWNVGSLFQ